MNYIKKYQQGKQLTRDDFSDSAWEGKPMQRSSIPAAPVPNTASGKQVMRNWMTGQPVTVSEMNNPKAGTPLVNNKQMSSTASTISGPQQLSVRQSVIKGMNKLDNYGDNTVVGIATQPVKSLMNLLRPDKYFNGVQSDEDVRDAVANIGSDVVNVLPVAEGAGRFLEAPMVKSAENVAAHKAARQGADWLNEWNAHPINTYRVAVNNEQVEGMTLDLPGGNKLTFGGPVDIGKRVNVQLPTKLDNLSASTSLGSNFDLSIPGDTQGYYVTDAESSPASLRGRAFVRTMEPSKVKSVSIHEGTHQYTNGNDGLSAETQHLLQAPFGGRFGIGSSIERNVELSGHDPAKVAQSILYYTDPTEVHARLNQLREHYGIKPDQPLDYQNTGSILNDIRSGGSPVDAGFGNLVKDPIAWNKMFNKMFTPAVVGAAGATTYHSIFSDK